MNKPALIPEFTLGEQFLELRPRLGDYKYRFLLLQTLEMEFLCPFMPRGQRIKFKDTSGNIWMEMTRKSIIVHKGYAWDGCTPKRWFGIWWGTPDFPETIVASLIHDVLLQFSKTDHFPLSKYEIDNIFKEILRRNRFSFRSLYYFGVRIGSMIFNKKYKNVVSELISDIPEVNNP